ncbi:MAG: hypothetical protein EA369_07235 [Bradymonadales bacterium]|nr:MAG: hypothetical protein EA369_07235 [Bradymonadales bacterium]
MRLLAFGFFVGVPSFLLAEESENRSGRLFPDKEFYSREEVAALQTVLEQRSNLLEQDIETQKEYVESLKRQVREHLEKIQVARNEIADFMNARDEQEEAKLRKLARFYEAMEPEQASPLLQRVQDDLAIKIFDRMDARKAGGILALYPAPRAAKITAAFPRLRLQVERVAGAD